MSKIRSMNKSQWLLPLMVMSVALMAFAFWAATNKVEAQNSGYMGIMNEDLVLIETSSAGGAGAAGAYTTILSGEIRTPQWEDTVLGVSLECGLYTDTKVKSKGGKSDTSTAMAKVQVRVLVDGIESAPGEIRFCERTQTLMAKFAGYLDLDTCTDEDGDGTITYFECDLLEEELQLILDTVSANHFNFVTLDLESGNHTIEVQAKITTSADWEEGSAEARGFIGKGSLIVDEVRLAKSVDLSSN